jgi:dTDP-glucose 4,6-dehydratase
MRLVDRGSADPVNLGNPVETTIEEFARTVIRITESSSEIVYRPLPEDDPKVRQPDIGKARDLLKWEPRVDLEEGLRRSLPYFQERVHGKS